MTDVVTARRMQGRIGPLVLVVFAAALVTGACDLPAAADGGDDSADYAQVCTDAAGNAQPDSDCDHAPDAFAGDAYEPADSYMWRYYPASNLVIVPYGQRMPSGGSVRRPVTISVPAGSGGMSRPAKVQMPSAGSSGGALTKAGSSSSISRGGFGVKGGGSASSPGVAKGGSSSAGSGSAGS